MAPLFSKVDLNKLWHDVQNEETLICAKFRKDLFNISEVIGRKKSGPVFLTHSVYTAKSRSQKCRNARGFDPHHLTLPYLTLNRVGKGTLLTNAEPPESPMNLSEITWMLLKPRVSFRKTMRGVP